jgi:hypothetical protein
MVVYVRPLMVVYVRPLAVVLIFVIEADVFEN